MTTIGAGIDEILDLPGLVDLQVNGWGGIDFNAPDLRVDQVEDACVLLAHQGIVSFLPTVVTASPETMARSIETIIKASQDRELAASMIAGIHVEGPFISPLDGPRGAHSREWTRAPDIGLAENLWLAAEGRIKILTLAPELPGAIGLIAWCAQKGVVAAIGHSAAEPENIAAAVEAGARLSTHLGNGCATSLARHPNLIWEQLAEDKLIATIIADGHHLPLAVMKCFARTKGDGLILISDSTAIGGMKAGRYEAPIGGNVVLDENGRLHVEGSPSLLAGAALPLVYGVHRLVDLGVVDFATAWEMASTRPARLLGMDAPPRRVRYDGRARRFLEPAPAKGI